jgi:putative transposase
MANTYSQFYAHIVFSTKGREPFLKKEFRQDVFKYISGIIVQTGNKSFIVNGIEDHVHLLVGLSMTCSVSELVREVKRGATLYMNGKVNTGSKFSWQVGYGCFSVSRSQVRKVFKYIEEQELHHHKITFKEEYINFLNSADINYNLKHVFD